MKNPLDSILGTIIAGLILTVILFFFAKHFLNQGPAKTESATAAPKLAKLVNTERHDN